MVGFGVGDQGGESFCVSDPIPVLHPVLHQEGLVEQMDLAVTEQNQEAMPRCFTTDDADGLGLRRHIGLDAKWGGAIAGQSFESHFQSDIGHRTCHWPLDSRLPFEKYLSSLRIFAKS
jgi:hypothetical protein